MVVLTMTIKAQKFAYIVVNVLNTRNTGATCVVNTDMKVPVIAVITNVRNVERIKMEFFESLDAQAQKKAYENLAYQLLDDYLYNYREDAEERLMNSLKGEREFHYLYLRWAEKQVSPA